MEGTKGFAEIWNEAHRERSEFVWSMISRLMATPRRPAPKAESPIALTPAVQR
jgi:hypothetical protein